MSGTATLVKGIWQEGNFVNYGVISGADFIKHEATIRNKLGNINFDRIDNYNHCHTFQKARSDGKWWKKESPDRCLVQLNAVQRVLTNGTSSAPIDQFYQNTIFNQKEDYKIAVIVPFQLLSKMKSTPIFANDKIRLNRFEALEDFYNIHNQARCEYDTVIDLSDDEELWDGPVASDTDHWIPATSPREIDVFIRTHLHSAEESMVRELAAKMWENSEGRPGYWTKPGQRR